MKQNTLHRYFLLIVFPAIIFGCNSAIDKSDDITTADTSSHYYTLDTSEKEIPFNENIGAGEEKARLIKKYENLLVFHADDTMEINNTYITTLALAKNADVESVTLKVLDASDATDDKVIMDTTIEIGKRMRAKLWDMGPRNSPNFYITDMSPGEQSLQNKNKEAFWQWNVEPLKEGNHELKLTVEVVVSEDDRLFLPARDIPVIIYAKKPSFFSKIGGFFSGYWQWIITAIFVPVMIAFLTTRMKQTTEKRKSK